MTAFQIISIILSGLLILAAIAGVYTKMLVEIAKINVHILNLQHEMNIKEIAITKLEEKNSTQHKEIIDKLDAFIISYYQKG